MTPIMVRCAAHSRRQDPEAARLLAAVSPTAEPSHLFRATSRASPLLPTHRPAAGPRPAVFPATGRATGFPPRLPRRQPSAPPPAMSIPRAATIPCPGRSPHDPPAPAASNIPSAVRYLAVAAARCRGLRLHAMRVTLPCRTSTRAVQPSSRAAPVAAPAFSPSRPVPGGLLSFPLPELLFGTDLDFR
nr:uncharacterized protein LOC127315381 [Lolium perenne]